MQRTREMMQPVPAKPGPMKPGPDKMAEPEMPNEAGKAAIEEIAKSMPESVPLSDAALSELKRAVVGAFKAITLESFSAEAGAGWPDPVAWALAATVKEFISKMSTQPGFEMLQKYTAFDPAKAYAEEGAALDAADLLDKLAGDAELKAALEATMKSPEFQAARSAGPAKPPIPKLK